VRAIRLFIILCLAGLLAACGFQLRGSYALPFKTMSIALPPNTPLYALLKRNIESSSPTRIVEDAKDAEATLSVLADRNEKLHPLAQLRRPRTRIRADPHFQVQGQRAERRGIHPAQPDRDPP